MKDLNYKSFRILAVDDDSTIRDLYQGILKSNSPSAALPNFELTCCSQGDEAVEAVKRSFEDDAPFAVAFLDLNMPPGPDGEWTAEEIHKVDPRIITVVVTGYRSTNFSKTGQQARFSDKLLYLQKPFHPREIIQFATALSIKWQAQKQLLTMHADLENLVEQRTAELVKSNRLLKIEIENRKRMQQELQQSFESLKIAMHSTIQAISMTVEKRDPYTSGHQQRVANLAKTIAEELELPESQIESIYMAAGIHDIGKISLPAEILVKPIPLSDIEISLVQAHAQAGYDILKGIDFPWAIADIVLQHHERMDGSGYPLGLAGDNIVFEARIICVADVVETMASHRPYRPSIGMDKALEEIVNNRGVLYDPQVVDACLKIFKEKDFSFPG
ncbi:Response regulator/sensory box/HDIG domain protein [Olavius sp. associated proteobacterium Delta 1]|nr:Response regulator/sensory box/HDIG domain protein [Olavius sp. associated proteobacterium Delta 1]